MLKVQEITKRFGGVVAINDVSFEVSAGKIVSLVGPNGAGKTTLFNVISGIYKSDQGSVHFDGQDVSSLSPYKRARLGIGRTFQNVRLFANLNALENVMVGRSCRTQSGVLDAIFCRKIDRQSRANSRKRSEEIMDWVGVADFRYSLPSALSYGDQRRVEIARALATDPKLLILDEPTAGMAADEAQAVIDLMHKLTEKGHTLLLIEHNMKVVNAVSDQVVVINFGQKITEGNPEQVMNNPEVIEAYLGRED
jgi:branched-chain amino acid transport system ATP-binding protein